VRGEEGVAGWSAHVEEVLSWLLEAEDHLMALNSLGQKHLMTVKTRQETARHTVQADFFFINLVYRTLPPFASVFVVVPVSLQYR
jgi:hypothetical protein